MTITPTMPTTSPASVLARQGAIGARALSTGGHDDFNQGQISCRRPGSDHFIIKGALVGFDEAVLGDFVPAVVEAGAPADRLAPPELPLHQAIYSARDDVGAIVHSHSPSALVFGALTDTPLVPLSHEGALLADQVRYFRDTSNTVLGIDTGNAIARDLGDGVAVFLVNHGSVIVGRSVRHAVVFALMLERACSLQLAALASGRGFSQSHAQDVADKRDYIFSDLSVRSYWDYTRRRVARLFPESTEWAQP
ncbi:MAG TPA: class II aldolase/adducin family protein [Gordonia sp. (in: high G+C Gram-positive bacteria)]|uniref:class II aldolase/adducin family protein n=1 Tax=unclassified Gordonia (in: high G+C Gram-positive bacteria) TaxID=2657482 RepID=UPI000FAFAE5C|nr:MULTISPECIES: class II aldolase/adducin family protein [unclassified Gordonia (in: high G+C Gram-positive bacteria)]RUP37612.1 MAG: class II aldolase/adducin family protein [Gordonia sp. (in: high G+C Gram-positive bacteria)]HNP58496.1 class II aldolase/adducin family protein [Gordonia sp. (in: high G+C Gram-positive bacteria)]HRC51463.1 class II aldolase/adducin family protein [Gordonia sp. (in: high G+C Gram-positive bacteria)]